MSRKLRAGRTTIANSPNSQLRPRCPDDTTEHHPIYGPFAVIGSDLDEPTTVVRTLGLLGRQAIEPYDAEPVHPILFTLFAPWSFIPCEERIMSPYRQEARRGIG